MEITKDLAQRVDDIVSQGLVSGLGEPIPGQMCIEAAICFALGLPHADNPPCVGSAVRNFKIRLNDSRWSSNEARTSGMRKLAIAQLGSDQVNQVKFVELVTLGVIREILPIILRSRGFIVEADRCEKVINLTEGKEAAYAANAAANAAAYAAADAAADAAAYANAAAYAAADAAGNLILNKAADICLRTLITLQSPGVVYLYIIPE